MQHNLSVNKAFLKFLLDGTKAQISDILKRITTGQLKALTEICFNLLAGNVPLDSEADRRKLLKCKKIIRLFGDKKTSFKVKKSLLLSKHSFLKALRKIILPAALKLLGI